MIPLFSPKSWKNQFSKRVLSPTSWSHSSGRPHHTSNYIQAAQFGLDGEKKGTKLVGKGSGEVDVAGVMGGLMNMIKTHCIHLSKNLYKTI